METANDPALVIIGAGQAAAQLILSLRQVGDMRPITLIGNEPVPPYQRPPLSKAYMKGEFAEERLYFKPSSWYAENAVEMILGVEVKAINREGQWVTTEHGARLPYTNLVIATGSRPRPLPISGADLDGVFDLRSIGDVQQIKPHMMAGARMVIIGAGYIGLEAAAVARQMGLEVTVLEMADRVLARVAGAEISEFYRREHERRGVTIRTATQARKIYGTDGTVTGVELADGTRLDADLVLVGIGIIPNDQVAVDCGLTCDNGIVVDEDARTSDPAIFAAGECTVRPLSHYQRTARLDRVHNAIEQGKLAAAGILGRARPRVEVPWFWSDQYDLKLQIAGLSTGHDRTVVRGNPDDGRFSVFYLKDGALIAVDAINSPPEFLVSKTLIAAGACPDPAQLADRGVSMKDIAGALTG